MKQGLSYNTSLDNKQYRGHHRFLGGNFGLAGKGWLVLGFF